MRLIALNLNIGRRLGCCFKVQSIVYIVVPKRFQHNARCLIQKD